MMSGTWSDKNIWRKGYTTGALSPPFGAVKSFVADAADGTIPDLPVVNISGLLTGIEVEFDDVTPPNSLTVTLKTIGGITVISNTSPLTNSGLIELYQPFDLCGGYILSASGNTTPSAKAIIICKFR